MDYGRFNGEESNQMEEKMENYMKTRGDFGQVPGARWEKGRWSRSRV